MKYTEFIKKICKLDFAVNNTDDMIICTDIYSDKPVISISKISQNSMAINISARALTDTMAIKWATKLARTPLKDREGSAQYEIMLPNLLTSAENHQYITEYKGYYFVSAPSSQYGKRVFSEYDMLNVPKEYHVFAKDIETGEPYISEGVSL